MVREKNGGKAEPKPGLARLSNRREELVGWGRRGKEKRGRETPRERGDEPGRKTVGTGGRLGSRGYRGALAAWSGPARRGHGVRFNPGAITVQSHEAMSSEVSDTEKHQFLPGFYRRLPTVSRRAGLV